jgi:hypothetical protein
MYVNAKLIPVEMVLGIRGGGLGERRAGEKFKFDVFDTL